MSKTIFKAAELPPETHYAALVSEHVTVNDGWDDTTTLRYMRYEFIGPETAVEAWITKNAHYDRTKDYKIIRVTPCAIETTVKVEVIG